MGSQGVYQKFILRSLRRMTCSLVVYIAIGGSDGGLELNKNKDLKPYNTCMSKTFFYYRISGVLPR